MKTIIVFCHLRWDFVYQRPQQLLSRLAEHYRILFVEEPMRSAGPARIESMQVAPAIEVLRPHTPLSSFGFADDQLAMLGPMLDDLWSHRGIEHAIVWFYTPMALPLLDACGALCADIVVYDCMDELSAFLGAPPELRRREAELLDRADVVLTGGPSIYEAKRHAGAKVLCLPSSVDAAHFAPRDAAADDLPAREAAMLQADIGSPKLGFFGVIDERMDLPLVAALADADPGWHVVMVGPVVKIAWESLPRRANLHWLGQRTYALLPPLVQTWHVCLLPFALNDATRFISPTKTLEYMAAGKPTVSTAIRDVATLYGEFVRIAPDAADFIAACRDAVALTDAERNALALDMAAAVFASSWDRTAERVREAVDIALRSNEDRLAVPRRA